MYRSFQRTSCLLLLQWLFDSAIACSPAGVGCPGCADCSKMLCSLCMSRSTGPCENSSCNQFNDGGCSCFQLATVHRRPLLRMIDPAPGTLPVDLPCQRIPWLRYVIDPTAKNDRRRFVPHHCSVLSEEASTPTHDFFERGHFLLLLLIGDGHALDSSDV